MSERLNMMLDDGVADLMSELAGGERKRGQWLSELVRAMHEESIKVKAGGDLETMRYAFTGMVGQVKMVEGRLLNVERQLAALIAERK